VEYESSLNKVKINNEMKYDAQLWLQFIEYFNGVVYFPEKEWVSNETLQLFTDSTGCEYLGCGAYAEGKWEMFSFHFLFMNY
jgi:uncharacterized protein (DUF427 family)